MVSAAFAFVLSTKSADRTSFVTSTTIFNHYKNIYIYISVVDQTVGENMRWQKNLSNCWAAKNWAHCFRYARNSMRTKLFYCQFVWFFSFSWGCGWSIGHLLRGGVLLSKLFESSQSRCVSWPRTDKNDKNSGKNGHFNMISKSFRYEIKLIAWCAFPIVSMAICRAAGVFLSNWKCIADLKKNDGNLRVYFVNGSVWWTGCRQTFGCVRLSIKVKNHQRLGYFW